MEDLTTSSRGGTPASESGDIRLTPTDRDALTSLISGILPGTSGDTAGRFVTDLLAMFATHEQDTRSCTLREEALSEKVATLESDLQDARDLLSKKTTECDDALAEAEKSENRRKQWKDKYEVAKADADAARKGAGKGRYPYL